MYTWTSPNGQRACIDYVLVPQELQAGLCTVGKLAGFVDLYDFDHQPLLVEVTWSKALPVVGRSARIDTRAIDTIEGRQKLQQIYRHAPAVDWSVDVDHHLLILNSYLHDALVACFPAPLQRPRETHFSDGTWAVVRLRRGQRRTGHRARNLQAKVLLHLCFQAWEAAGLTLPEPDASYAVSTT